MVRTAEWKYIYEPEAGDELYDLRCDPHELCNLARQPACAEVITNFRRQLLDWTIATESTLPPLQRERRDD